MKNNPETKQREILEEKWKLLAEDLQSIGEKFTSDRVKEFKPLFYETFEYFFENKASGSVLRSDLRIYHFISIFTSTDIYPGIRSEVNLRCCQSFAESLCWGIENGFEEAYCFKKTIPFDILSHGSNNWTDMSTYETFEKDFGRLLKMYEEEYEELLAEEEEEQEDM
ncbi:MAG: hypothetical protein IKH13_02560 [Clostridia bacterium]|nr:hypothetical protein [Clostridia bacterium]